MYNMVISFMIRILIFWKYYLTKEELDQIDNHNLRLKLRNRIIKETNKNIRKVTTFDSNLRISDNLYRSPRGYYSCN